MTLEMWLISTKNSSIPRHPPRSVPYQPKPSRCFKADLSLIVILFIWNSTDVNVFCQMHMLCCQSNEVINFKDNAHHHSVSGLFLFVFVAVSLCLCLP